MFNNDIISNFTLEAAAIIPIITAVVQAFKMTQWVKDKYAPFLAMLVGIGITFLLAHDASNNISSLILSGILFGLASSGLYSGLQTTVKAIKMDRQQKQFSQQNNQAPNQTYSGDTAETQVYKSEAVYQQKTKNPHNK